MLGRVTIRPTKGTAMSDSPESTTKSATRSTKSGFTAEERAAMKERARELKASATKADWAREVLEKIADMPPSDRAIAERLHAVITENAPSLDPKLWYGMPAYARDGKIVCFFQAAEKFNTRYGTLGFNDSANLDAGAMWPTAYAITTLNADDEDRIGALVKQAVS